MAKTSRPAPRTYQRQTAVARPAPVKAQPAATPVESAKPDTSAQPQGALAELMERASKEVLAVTYWFDPVPRPEPYSVTVRLNGRRVNLEGPPQRGDEFLMDETIDEVVPGSGPIALTSRVRDINPGEWEVKATTVEYGHSRRGKPEPEHAHPVTQPDNPLAKLWFKWAPPVDQHVHLKTGPEAYMRIPGVIPLVWVGFVTLGMIVAVIVQALLGARYNLPVGSIFFATAAAIGAGIIGAKIWYIIKHRAERDFIGWCIQGFILGASLAAIVLFAGVMRAPLGTVLDVTAPGLMFGLAVGRIGCFFAGCCGGPPTSARWGVWCSDQHVGARRVPTQLFESGFSLLVGLVTLAALLAHGPAGGAFFVAVIAAYTLFREGLLRLRAEPVTMRLPFAITPIISTVALLVAVVFIVR